MKTGSSLLGQFLALELRRLIHLIAVVIRVCRNMRLVRKMLTAYIDVPPYDPTSTVNRPRPIPPGLQLKSDYHGASSTNLSALRMQSAPLAPPPEYHSPQLSAPYYSTSFGNTPSTQQSNEPSTSHLPSMNSAYHASDEPAPPQRYMQPPPQHYTSHDGNQGSINFGLPRRSFTYGPGSVQQ